MILRLFPALIFTTALAAQPADLAVKITAVPDDAQQQADVTVEIETLAPFADPEEIRLDIDTLGGIRFISWSAAPGVMCTQPSNSPQWLQCALPSLPAGSKTTVNLRIEGITSARTGHVTARLTWRDRGFRTENRYWRKDVFRYSRELVVTNNGDAGAGSLREVIAAANAQCTAFNDPCRIRFDLGPNAIIRLNSALPPITAELLAIEGDSRVTLDGSFLTPVDDGLTIAGRASVNVRGLTIQKFPDHGIFSTTHQVVKVENCVITGNGSRGVMVTESGISMWILDSVISGNRRSAVFADRSTLMLERNRMEDNGASGIFIGSGAYATIRDNVIANNVHWGVATVRANRNVNVERNRITGNGAGAIDIDLDGPSFFPKPAIGQFAPPNGPTLTSATYDPATNRTTVRGRQENVDFAYFLTYDLHFYATTTPNEADQYLGSINVQQADFTVTFPGDLRGRLITANTVRFLTLDFSTERGTSELSPPIEVRLSQ